MCCSTLSHCHAFAASGDFPATDGDACKHSDADHYRDTHAANGDTSPDRHAATADRYCDRLTNSYSHAGTDRRIQH
jgi:hypothetical protein